MERVLNVIGAPEGKEDDDEFPVLYLGSALAVITITVVGGVVIQEEKGDSICDQVHGLRWPGEESCSQAR